MQAILLAIALLASSPVWADIPVTSDQIDVGDDPENAYSGAPQFDWGFFGNRTRVITKSPANYLNHREALGVDYKFYFLESKSFAYPASQTIDSVIRASPVIPVIQFANIGKINRAKEDGERAVRHDPSKIRSFQSHYPNLIIGGGQTAEVDGDFGWLYSQYYGRLPVGSSGRAFPAAYQDFIESNLKRSGFPYLMQQHNQSWGTHYVAKERAMSMSAPQLFYRRTASIVDSLVTSRSAARQYPHPFGVQFSGQPVLEIKNASEVLKHGTKPLYQIGEGKFGSNYGKSYALNRQMLYFAWLNGARFFNWEGREFINTGTETLPSPLGTFTSKAADFIGKFGPVGPVQTPIAIISEFSNAWQPPEIRAKGAIGFHITGDVPYAKGDYQLHGLRDFFYPHYLQCESIYETAMREDNALCPTPYGNSIDYLLSDVRQAALQRYGLLVWGGVPPESPSVSRDKLLEYVNARQGRVVLFGSAARRMFPDWFDDRPASVVKPGAAITYGGDIIEETSDFLLENLRKDLDASALSIKVLSSVNGRPLIVECLGGLVLVLSDFGINQTMAVSPEAASWHENQIVTDIPHRLLHHAGRILDDEAAKCRIFSVGNKQLHFVTTRPTAGEYLIGIFNDKLSSEPFKITSNIGAITSIHEVPLSDSKQDLKNAAGGAAYAPPGLRKASMLPLDYGLSDASHIEGRDFRLFRIKVAESGVRTIPSIRYPKRPGKRVLAVAGLDYIRSHIQGIPSFFQWFDGVKVDAVDLLSMDDQRIQEQAHWLNRRGVRVVIDAAGMDEKAALSVLKELSFIKGALKDLIIASPSAELRSTAAAQGVTLQEPATVNRLNQPGHEFQPGASLNIVDLHYQREEDLHLDLQGFGSNKRVASLCGKPHALDLLPDLDQPSDTKDDFTYVGPCVQSLSGLLEHDESVFEKFRGVKVDSTYLLCKTTAELSKDAARLKQMGLEVIVDLRRDQMHHDGITLYPHIPNHESGLALYKEVIAKMRILGASDLIVRIQDVGGMRNKPEYIAQRDGTWNAFAEWAGDIRLHLTFDPGLKLSPVAGFSRSNVFVLSGNKGTASPFRLVQKSGTTGKGKVKVHDEDGGLYSSGLFEPAERKSGN